MNSRIPFSYGRFLTEAAHWSEASSLWTPVSRAHHANSHHSGSHPTSSDHYSPALAFLNLNCPKAQGIALQATISSPACQTLEDLVPEAKAPKSKKDCHNYVIPPCWPLVPPALTNFNTAFFAFPRRQKQSFEACFIQHSVKVIYNRDAIGKLLALW